MLICRLSELGENLLLDALLVDQPNDLVLGLFRGDFHYLLGKQQLGHCLLTSIVIVDVLSYDLKAEFECLLCDFVAFLVSESSHLLLFL